MDRGNLARHVLPLIGGRPVGSITRADLQYLVDAWRSRYAPSTVVRMFSTVRALFGYAEAAELIGRSPCRHIRLPQVTLPTRPTPASDALERLAEELGPDQAVMMWTGAVLGLRWGECAGLTVGSVDTLRRMVTVGEQLRRGDRQLVAPKSNAGRRTMAVPAWLTEELSALMHRRSLTAADSGGLLFVNTKGRPWSYSPWRRSVWLPACTRAGLPGLRFHDLRALAATNLVAAGVASTRRQRRLASAIRART